MQINTFIPAPPAPSGEGWRLAQPDGQTKPLVGWLVGTTEKWEQVVAAADIDLATGRVSPAVDFDRVLAPGEIA